MRLLLFLLTILLATPLYAQKKEIDQAKTYIKSRSNLDKAETSMRELLKDSANKRNIKIWLTLSNVMHTQYELANEKLYLKERLDTATLFHTAHRMFLVDESLDSLDAQIDKKGRIRAKYRKKNSLYLDKYRQNLYYGGLFFVRNKDFVSAYDLFDAYLDCRCQPLFSELNYTKNDNMQQCSSAAFWTVLCGYNLNRPDSALKYSDMALSDKKLRTKTLQYLAEIYLMKKDTTSYVTSLLNGFFENKTSEFFFTRLMDYYNNKNLLDSALQIADTALAADSKKELFLFAKSNILLNLGHYSECISISDTLISLKTLLPDVYYNAGISYINKALILEKSIASQKKNKKEIISYYKKSLPYMEKYRELRPDDKTKWAPSLYNIYLKLNMGHQFEEISRVLWDMRQ